MDFDLSGREQQAYDRALAVTSAHQDGDPAALLRALEDKGLFASAQEGPAGRTAAALAVEAVSRGGGLAPAGLHALVLPLFEAEPGGLGCMVSAEAPSRFGATADLGVVLHGEVARLYPLAPSEAQAVQSNYIYPLGRSGRPAGPALAQVESAAVQRRWRVALGVEAVGAMDAALSQLSAFLSERSQFGRKLATFQALHHRMAELAVLLESSRWLVREAAWLDEDEAAATAALFAARAARRICWEAHQLSGARGFTLDFGLHRHTLRLQLISVEAGGAVSHAAAAAGLRWGAPEDAGAHYSD